jgi:hypothetical protein
LGQGVVRRNSTVIPDAAIGPVTRVFDALWQRSGIHRALRMRSGMTAVVMASSYDCFSRGMSFSATSRSIERISSGLKP